MRELLAIFRHNGPGDTGANRLCVDDCAIKVENDTTDGRRAHLDQVPQDQIWPDVRLISAPNMYLLWMRNAEALLRMATRGYAR